MLQIQTEPSFSAHFFQIHQQNRKGPGKLLAEVVRRVIGKRKTLSLSLTFPQNGCCYLFGENRSPLTLGVLFDVWGSSPGRSRCPVCSKETLYMVYFGGLLSIGGGGAVCTSCDELVMNFMGGMGWMAQFLKSRVTDSSFYISQMTLFGVHADPGAKLLASLDIQTEDGNIPTLTELYGADPVMEVNINTGEGDVDMPTIQIESHETEVKYE